MSAQKLIFDIDVSVAQTQDDLRREFAKHFRLDKDHSKFWLSFADALLYMPTACTFRFHGWAEFQKRMPRYARRIQDMIQRFQHGTSEETYKIEYL